MTINLKGIPLDVQATYHPYQYAEPPIEEEIEIESVEYDGVDFAPVADALELWGEIKDAVKVEIQGGIGV